MKDKRCPKVRDHYHYTGEYSGAVHKISDLKNSITKKLDIIMIFILS